MAGRQRFTDAYPHGSSFGQLLDWHLWRGTRPGYGIGGKNPRWLFVDFAHVIHLDVPATKSDDNPTKKLRLWREGRHLPNNDTIVQAIFDQLFADDPLLTDWKSDLRKALEKESEDKTAIPVAKLPQSAPSLGFWRAISREADSEHTDSFKELSFKTRLSEDVKKLSEKVAAGSVAARMLLAFRKPQLESDVRLANIIVNFEQRRQMYSGLGSIRGQVSSIKSLGQIAEDLHDFASARIAYTEALTICEKEGDLVAIGRFARLLCSLPDSNGSPPAPDY